MLRFLFSFAAVLAGAAIAFQGAANAGLSARTGLGAALVINTSVVLISAMVFLFAGGSSSPFFPPDTPWFLYIGGLCGFGFILASAFVFPKIGAAPSVALIVLGQGAAALAIDHFGLMGLTRQPVSASHIGGFVLIVSGVMLLKR